MEDSSKKTIDLSKLSEEEVNNILLQAEALKRQKKRNGQGTKKLLTRWKTTWSLKCSMKPAS